MKTTKLSQNDLEYIQSLIESDITEPAFNSSFFDEMKLEPKDYIDQMTAVAKMFGLNFWEVINRSCSESESERLRALYDGKPSRKVIDFNTLTVQNDELAISSTT